MSSCFTYLSAGYSIQNDLAQHYGFAEICLLALSGTPPSPEQGRAFELALAFAGSITVAHAPVHAAVLARMCGTPWQGVIGIGTTSLIDQAQFELSSPPAEEPAPEDSGEAARLLALVRQAGLPVAAEPDDRSVAQRWVAACQPDNGTNPPASDETHLAYHPAAASCLYKK